jgi:hypothetical protein
MFFDFFQTDSEFWVMHEYLVEKVSHERSD